MKKKRLTTVIVILLIVTGLSLLLYPTLSDFLKSMSYRKTISAFKNAVAALDDETYDAIWESAQDYNARLFERGSIPSYLSDQYWEDYESQLDVTGSGVMGYITVSKLNLSLPIYHGTSESVLQTGVGHLEGTSLPVGGENTHTVLSAHTGLPSAKLFTDLDHLQEGDTFQLHILSEVLTYEVDQILVVLPAEQDALEIVPGEDYCTLLTCTPYGVNSHRLLVRGHRIPTPETEEPQGPIQIVVPEIGPVDVNYVRIIAGAVGLVALVIIIVVLTRRMGRRYRGKRVQPRDKNSRKERSS